jgi:beta-N-acetylhexosaminidase
MVRSKVSLLRRAAGRVLIVGVEGTSLTAMEQAWLKLIRPSGVILFRRNIEDAHATHALLESVQKATGGPLFRCVDVEGGTVDRLRDLMAPMPSAQSVGRTRSTKLFATHGRLIGKESRMLGFNVTFAPVLDLQTASSASVMTSRVVSSDAEEVIEYARHFLAGLGKEGLLGCGKHFPGLGSGQVDSHHSTPRIEKSMGSLWQEDLLPYRKLTPLLDFVMISHATYPLTPSGEEPASISSFWTDTILRKKMGFRNLIVSDDMEMGGVLSYTSLADAVVRAILAGTHLIEICREPALVLGAYEALLNEAEHSPAFARKLARSAAVVEKFKRRRREVNRLSNAPTPSALEKARREIQRFSEEVMVRGERSKSQESVQQ